MSDGAQSRTVNSEGESRAPTNQSALLTKDVSSNALRHWRGWLSIAGAVLHPLGRFCGGLLRHLRTPDRLERGLILILPGIEGQSWINHGIALGLSDAGVNLAIEIFDWTTGVILFFPYHLRASRRNKSKAAEITRKIQDYQAQYPGRPVHVIGHSGGAAMALLALEALPQDNRVQVVVLLAAAVSPTYNLAPALARTEHGIWSFNSVFDRFFLDIGTRVGGTFDGRHSAAAGMCGFQNPANLSIAERELYVAKLHEVAYTWAMVRSYHLGGHLGWANRVLIADCVAPLILRTATTARAGYTRGS